LEAVTHGEIERGTAIDDRKAARRSQKIEAEATERCANDDFSLFAVILHPSSLFKRNGV
jgi:hypothetical protein